MQLDSVAAASATVERATSEHVVPAAAPILVAVDFSPESEAALLWACAHAERVGAPIEVLHVIHDPVEAPGKYRPDDRDPLEPMAEVAEHKLAEFLAGVRTRHPETSGLAVARAICRPGLPPGTIVDLARESGARHLVVGSRDRNGLARAVLGSTSEHVARHATVPVTIVKAKRK